jgi:hypothetical protein
LGVVEGERTSMTRWKSSHQKGVELMDDLNGVGLYAEKV